MANREACEVYIDQEIADGLKKGKKPYSIGKELSAWIVKLFEVRIEPTTIEKRAERKQKQQQLDFPTNVGKNSKVSEINTDSIKDRHPQGGGEREGAGRPKGKPAVTKRDKEFFAQFEFPVETIATGTFTLEECHSRLMESPKTKINHFKKTLELLNAVDAKGVNI